MRFLRRVFLEAYNIWLHSTDTKYCSKFIARPSIMNIFMQGMRRSGTTICFDILKEDPFLDCYYEPLAAANKPAIGGGSGERTQDFFEKIRRIRADFLKKYQGLNEIELLNYGAPRDPLLEFEKDVPEYIKAYIRFLTCQCSKTLIKFTRMYCKVEVLQAIDPSAKFIHIVRNPAAVATSYLYGKGQRNKYLFDDNDLFFTRQSTKTAWSSFPFSEYILNLPEYRHLSGIRDFERVLLIWKYVFFATHSAGKALFGNQYLLLSHDALTLKPNETVTSLYRHLGSAPPDSVIHWALDHVRQRNGVHEPHNRHWKMAIDRLDLHREMAIFLQEIPDFDSSWLY